MSHPAILVLIGQISRWYPADIPLVSRSYIAAASLRVATGSGGRYPRIVNYAVYESGSFNFIVQVKLLPIFNPFCKPKPNKIVWL